MARQKTTAQFIEKAIVAHGDRYDYSKSIYTGCYSKLVIGCRKHGDFEQSASDHCQGYGCPMCTRSLFDITSFVKNSTLIHGGKYDYSKSVYTGNKNNIVVTCPIHGDFITNPDRHVHGKHGCSACSRNKKSSTSEFIALANAIHGNLYDYSDVVYVNNKTKIIIRCKKHGSFLQSPNNHINCKSGCPKCGDERTSSINKGRYNYEYFVSQPNKKDSPAKLYVVEFNKSGDKFIKVGITTQRSVKKRFSSAPYNTYTITPLVIKEMTLFEAHAAEQLILLEMQQHSYSPGKGFAGYTECLKHCPEVIRQIENILNKEQNYETI